MSDVVVSIIVVSLNTKIDFLNTLHSIQEQKFDNYEVIVVDGASTDGTVDEIENNKKYISKYIIQIIVSFSSFILEKRNMTYLIFGQYL